MFMAEYVYLVRKEGFFLIGSSRDLDNLTRKIRPDEIIETLRLDHPQAFKARLLNRYRNSRLPGSGYFQFSEKQLLDCKKQFGIKSKIPKTISEEFTIALTGSIVLLVITALFFRSINILPLMSFALSLAFSSLPMWLLLFLGNFGGYDCSDLKPFSSWFNRIRALILASLLSVFSFLIFRLALLQNL
ncbi:putative NADH-ubiquinone/plastoquinone [Prochlorococcus sp. SS52]|nr:putative NADH-ubiquinone/plastoquinone [Prochlorococcus sp. SS52]